MGTFTMTVQEVIDLASEENRYKSCGLDVYPIFDASYRAALNEKIIAHFNEQEIAHETPYMWEYAMRRKMNEIMPLYNQHYLASQIEIDPLKTVSINVVGESVAQSTGTVTTETTDTSTTESTTDASGRVVGSNTPQVRLAGNGDYATTAQDSISKTTADGTATQNGNTEASNTGNQTDNTDTSTSGYNGNPAELVLSMRQAFVNVDMMIIAELETDMFQLIWDNGQEYTKGLNYGYSNFLFPFGW